MSLLEFSQTRLLIIVGVSYGHVNLHPFVQHLKIKGLSAINLQTLIAGRLCFH